MQHKLDKIHFFQNVTKEKMATYVQTGRQTALVIRTSK